MSAQQCSKCFYVFESVDDLNSHSCPAEEQEPDNVAEGQEQVNPAAVPFTESDDPYVIGPIEGAFIDNYLTAFVEEAHAGNLTVYKSRVEGAPEGMDATYTIGILMPRPEGVDEGEGEVVFRPVMVMWTDALNGKVLPRDPNIKTHDVSAETQEMNGSKD